MGDSWSAWKDVYLDWEARQKEEDKKVSSKDYFDLDYEALDEIIQEVPFDDHAFREVAKANAPALKKQLGLKEDDHLDLWQAYQHIMQRLDKKGEKMKKKEQVARLRESLEDHVISINEQIGDLEARLEKVEDTINPKVDLTQATLSQPEPEEGEYTFLTDFTFYRVKLHEDYAWEVCFYEHGLFYTMRGVAHRPKDVFQIGTAVLFEDRQ